MHHLDEFYFVFWFARNRLQRVWRPEEMFPPNYNNQQAPIANLTSALDVEVSLHVHDIRLSDRQNVRSNLNVPHAFHFPHSLIATFFVFVFFFCSFCSCQSAPTKVFANRRSVHSIVGGRSISVSTGFASHSRRQTNVGLSLETSVLDATAAIHQRANGATQSAHWTVSVLDSVRTQPSADDGSIDRRNWLWLSLFRLRHRLHTYIRLFHVHI